MAAANAWSLSIERKAKSRSVQGQRQITDHSLTVSQTVSHHGRLSLACLLSCYWFTQDEDGEDFSEDIPLILNQGIMKGHVCISYHGIPRHVIQVIWDCKEIWNGQWLCVMKIIIEMCIVNRHRWLKCSLTNVSTNHLMVQYLQELIILQIWTLGISVWVLI